MPNPTVVRIAAVCAAATLGLAGCSPQGTTEEVPSESEVVYPVFQTDPDVPVLEDVPYTDGVEPQLLDVCLPVSDDAVGRGQEPRPAIVSIHGGSWRRGDKAAVTWRGICQWFASEGYVTVSINYRLAPEHTFPAHFEDATDAVRWLRDEEQVEAFNLDPDRIGVFGGSAGGNLAALLGTKGEGDWTTGTRVAAVVDLSAPIDLTEAGAQLGGLTDEFRRVQLDYLGCTDLLCDAAREASPNYWVDETDPPFFVAHSIDEFVPLEQSEHFVDVLRDAGVRADLVTVEGTAHAAALLTEDMQGRIVAFFAETLRDRVGTVLP